MQIKWTEEASDSIEQTLDYWYRNNGHLLIPKRFSMKLKKYKKKY